MKVIGGLFLIFSAFVIGPIIRAFVVCKLWAWFVVGKFALPSIALWEAAGLSLIVAYLTHQVEPDQFKDKKFSEIISKGIGQIYIAPFIVLLFGWIFNLLQNL